MVPEPQPVPFCATGLMQGSVNSAAVSHRFLVRGRSLAGHGLAMASDFCPKIGRLSKNWPSPARGQFRGIWSETWQSNFLVQFLGRKIGLFLSVQFFGPRPSPIFHRADFLILYRNCKDKIGLENGPENWTGEKLAWRKIGLAKKLARKIGLPSFRPNCGNWPGAGPGQFFENRPLLAGGRFP